MAELTGHLDLGKVDMFGHSYDASAAFGAALADARVNAAMNLDGTVFGAARTMPISRTLCPLQSEPADDASFAPIFSASRKYPEVIDILEKH